MNPDFNYYHPITIHTNILDAQNPAKTRHFNEAIPKGELLGTKGHHQGVQGAIANGTGESGSMSRPMSLVPFLEQSLQRPLEGSQTPLLIDRGGRGFKVRRTRSRRRKGGGLGQGRFG